MRALPPTTSHSDVAVVDVDRTGAGTLRIGGRLVDHIVQAQPLVVVRVLLEYAATVNRDLTVLTRHADGHIAVHRLCPDGTVEPLCRPSTSLDSARPSGREHRRSSERKAQINPRDRALVAAAWKRSRRWLVGHSLWFMLGAQILLLVGSLTFIVVALAPYLWPRP